ncbi:MAG TPA: DUF2252 family protein [Vicinamibacterales bacterium]|nr:DUF2252 family protein [Vicinamibacterales bacterium]
MNIRSATDLYEQQLSAQTRIVRSDLIRKHERLKESPFVFFRGTFYRWIEQWPTVCRSVTDAPAVGAVGDLHVENFGTWRDVEGRLVWGVNDLDEVRDAPYTSDLVRLATSAALATRERHLRISLRDICGAMLDGYVAALESGGEPIVLEERRRWLRDVAMNDLRDPKVFWQRMRELPNASGVPADAIAALEAMLPAKIEYSLHRRIAGVGSLGRQRFVALAEWNGGLIAREAKAYVARDLHLLDRAVRARDPFFTISGSWVVRRLAPDCSRIEIADLPKKRSEEKLLRAMGFETGNLHLATLRQRPRILRDLGGRGARWLERAAAKMVDAVLADFREYRRS